MIRSTLILALLGASSSAPAHERTYLALDGRVADRMDHVRLRVEPAAKDPANPLFREDRPWEVRFDNLYPNILYDDGAATYKCWYSPFIVDELTTNTPPKKRADVVYHATPTREMGLCYATSRDGLHWDKPALGVVAFGGGTANNLVLRDSHGAGVFKDAHERNPARRYKLFGGLQIPGRKRSFQVAFSPDGIHWAPAVPCPEVGVDGDTHNNAIWAPDLKKYVGITRRLVGQRLVERTESPDFVHWSRAQEVLRGDLEHQTYAMTIFRYADLYLGLVMIFDLAEDRVHCELAWSPDTVHWERVDRGEPLIANSSVRGDYDWGCVYAAATPVVSGDSIRLYYGASDGPHTHWRAGFLALATLRRDRFAAWVPDGGEGTVVTNPLPVDGTRLVLNVDAAGGDFSVEVLGGDGVPIAGYSGGDAPWTRGVDDLRFAARWSGHATLDALRGRSVRFKFHLRGAKLYSFLLR